MSSDDRRRAAAGLTTIASSGARRLAAVTRIGPMALAALAALAAITLALQPARAAAPASEVSGARGAAGSPDPAVLYHNYCSVCHGDKGDGRSRATGALSTTPRDFTSEASKRELSRERIALAIAHGRPGTAMVGWKTQLSQTDIDRLAEHVYQRYVLGQGGPASTPGISGTQAHGGREADANGNPVLTPMRVDMTAGLPNGLKGDFKRGGAFYLANCATCHGARGDGAGPRAYFINPKPRNFIEDDSRARFNRVALFAAISEGRLGSEMPAWSKVSSPQQIADVAEYVFQTFVQGRPAAQAAAARR
ncbi:MAG: c-type cytochrome [Burkholderiaceae bacterium]|nr:c-type cytochrome [Burkholderiaceae bacterium]